MLSHRTQLQTVRCTVVGSGVNTTMSRCFRRLLQIYLSTLPSFQGLLFPAPRSWPCCTWGGLGCCTTGGLKRSLRGIPVPLRANSVRLTLTGCFFTFVRWMSCGKKTFCPSFTDESCSFKSGTTCVNWQPCAQSCSNPHSPGQSLLSLSAHPSFSTPPSIPSLPNPTSLLSVRTPSAHSLESPAAGETPGSAGPPAVGDSAPAGC